MDAPIGSRLCDRFVGAEQSRIAEPSHEALFIFARSHALDVNIHDISLTNGGGALFKFVRVEFSGASWQALVPTTNPKRSYSSSLKGSFICDSWKRRALCGVKGLTGFFSRDASAYM